MTEFVEGPDEAAYGRVTNPERFAALHGVARDLLARLQQEYDVLATDGPEANAEWAADGEVISVVRLVPRSGGGTHLTVALDRVPSVRLRYGRSGSGGRYPRCACDACDEKVDEAADHLRATVQQLVAGTYSEELVRTPAGAEITTRDSNGSGTAYYYGDEAAALGEPWQQEWPPWPRAQPDGTPASRDGHPRD